MPIPTQHSFPGFTQGDPDDTSSVGHPSEAA